MAQLKDTIVSGNLRVTDTILTDNVEAEEIKKRDGTSSQFLKADGSVDSNTYATTDSLDDYLPLSGGQMTGPVTFLAGNNKVVGLQPTVAGGSVTNNLDIGWDWATGAGSGMALRSNTATSAGVFDIYARNGTATANTKHLIGTPGGSLTWAGSEVITASKVDSALSSTSANPVKNSVIYTTIGGLDDLTYNEYNEIFDYPAIPNYTTVTKIYLDHFDRDVMIDDGYSSKVDWANYVHEEDDGCQSYVNSNSTFTYNNITYQVWSCQEDPDDTFPLLLNPNTNNFQSLAEKSLYYGGEGNYTFITLDDNDTTYATNKKWLYDVRGE